MDYKKIIKNKKLRLQILKLLSFIPDKQMIQLQYYIKLHRKCNLKHPQRYTEKLQWYKLYYRTPLMRQCVDKWEVRKYVEECGLSDILIPTVGVFDKVEDIDFEKLPEKFVIKDTLGGGGNEVIICNDKRKFNQEDAVIRMKEWLARGTSYKAGGREWVYGGREHRVIIEHYLESDAEKGGLIDYKFLCFQGKAEFLYVMADRGIGDKAGWGVFTAEFEKLDVIEDIEPPLQRVVPKPENYEKMIKIAEKLAKPFPAARIDLYNIEGKILFGEITFFDGSGYMSFAPDEFDFVMGEKFVLPERR